MDRLLFRWRDAIASAKGPPPTTRLVLLTLSLHMNEDGGDGFPSTRLLAERTGLSERAVCTHLERAVATGWLIRQRVGSGQAWKRMAYRPLIPDALNLVQQLPPKGTEAGSAASSGEGAERRSEGAEPHDIKVLNDVQSNSSVNSPSNSPSLPGVRDEPSQPAAKRKRNPKRASKKSPKTDPLAEPAQQLVRHLDAELKAAGVPGVGSRWGAAVKIAKSALRDDVDRLGELEKAVSWGMRSDYWRPRLIAQGAKLLRSVWAEYLEPQRRNGANGRRSAFHDRAGEGPRFADNSPWDYSEISE